MTLFVSEICCNRGEVWGLSRETRTQLLRSQAWFYCPFGHKQHYSKTPSESREDALRRERDRLKQDAARLEGEAKQQRQWRLEAEGREEHERRRVSAAKGRITRMKN